MNGEGAHQRAAAVPLMGAHHSTSGCTRNYVDTPMLSLINKI